MSLLTHEAIRKLGIKGDLLGILHHAKGELNKRRIRPRQLLSETAEFKRLVTQCWATNSHHQRVSGYSIQDFLFPFGGNKPRHDARTRIWWWWC